MWTRATTLNVSNKMDVETGGRSAMQPYYRRYLFSGDRLNTFEKYGWPLQMVQTATHMAEAGFFYSGYRDSVVCFSCGGGLQQWLPTDDPFEEHARHYPYCQHLEKKKGRQYVESILKERKRANVCPLVLSSCVRGPEVEVVSGKECLICTTSEREILFQPCLHFCTCFECSRNLTKCCICRKIVTHKLRIFSP